MRIVCVGKGGSGKSSVSWLLTNAFAKKDGYVCAIDADHNMDLMTLLGKEFHDGMVTFHRTFDEFGENAKQEPNTPWSDMVLDERDLPSFTLSPAKNPYSEKVAYQVAKSIDLMVVGLGADDVLYSRRCAHGHSAPLKYYLPLVDASNINIVVDGVAGADMLNAGVYTGADVVCVIVEPQPNSIRVCSQIRTVAERLGIPVAVIVNKAIDNSFLSEINEKFKGLILGYLPIDQTVMYADFNNLEEQTRESLDSIVENLSGRFSYTDTLVRLREFEKTRREEQW